MLSAFVKHIVNLWPKCEICDQGPDIARYNTPHSTEEHKCKLCGVKGDHGIYDHK